MEFENNENDLGFSFDIDGVEDAGTFEIELKEDAPSSLPKQVHLRSN